MKLDLWIFQGLQKFSPQIPHLAKLANYRHKLSSNRDFQSHLDLMKEELLGVHLSSVEVLHCIQSGLLGARYHHLGLIGV